MERERKEIYAWDIPSKGPFVLGVDIGGTNSNFGVFFLGKHTPLLIASLHYPSQQITDFALFFKKVVERINALWGITVSRACIGVAGAIYPHRIDIGPTNLDFRLNSNEIKNATKLKELFLINDFEAVALGVDMIDKKDLVVINPGVSHTHGNRGFIGAGTGLGKSIAVWQEGLGLYLPVPSEGGHADASLQDELEYKFVRYMHEKHNKCPVSWENILSGAGLLRIYHFFGMQRNYSATSITQEITEGHFNPDLISRYAVVDPQSADTFAFFIKLYARCAKSFALDTLSLNGMYIAGGIAAKNITMFRKPIFLDEFFRCGIHATKIRNIAVKIIADYNVSLYGAVKALQLHQQGLM